MIRLVLILLSLVALTCQADPVLRLNTTTQAPLHTQDHDGFLDQLVLMMLNQIGYTLETVTLPAERGLVNANLGLEDGEMSRVAGIDKLYPNLIPIPEKLMDMEFVVFSRYPIDLRESWQSLSNKTLAYINGWKILEQNIPYSAEVTKVRNPQQLFNLIKNKRTDYIIYIRWSGLFKLANLNMPDVKMRQPALVKKPMYLYLNKKHRQLIPSLSQSLKKLRHNGAYAKLVKHYLLPHTRSSKSTIH